MNTREMLELVSKRPFGRPVYDVAPEDISIGEIRSHLEQLANDGLIKRGSHGISYASLTKKGSEVLSGGD